MSLLHVAIRQWRQRPGRTLFSVLSVAIAVAAVLGTLLAQSSVRLSYRKFSEAVEGRPALDVVAMEGGRFAADSVPPLDDLPGVTASFPFLSRATSARVAGRRFRGLLVGLPLEQQPAWESLQLTEGRLCQDQDEVVLSADLAAETGVIGSRLIVMTRRGPRSTTVVGLASAESLNRFATGTMFVQPLQAVQDSFGLDGQVDRVRVMVDPLRERDEIESAIAARLPQNLLVQRPIGQMVLADSLLRSSELALRFAGVLSVAMAAFLILNTLRMNFGERRRDLATLRVLGATSHQVISLHLLEGATLGLVGSVAGIPLGLLLGRGLTKGIERLIAADIAEPQTPLAALFVALAVGPLVASLAALLPALQSRRISPVEAMGDIELRRADRFPVWGAALGLFAWCLAVVLIVLVALERISPELTIPAGLLMLIAFIALIPVVLKPVVRLVAGLLAPLSNVEVGVAADQILRRGTRTGLTVGVLVVAISNGLGLGNAVINNVNDVRDWYARTMSGDVFLIDLKGQRPAADRDAVSAAVLEQPGVRQLVELRYLPMRANGVPAMCLIRDFLPDDDLPWPLDQDKQNDVRARLADGETVLSTVLARKLEIDTGDRIRVDLQGRVFSLRVAALVNDYTLGGMAAYLDKAAATQMVDIGPAYIYSVAAKPNTSPEQLLEQLETLAGDQQLFVQSYAQLRGQLDQVINGVVGALWGLLAVGFFVGGIAVANTLTMSVLEQTRELGLLRIVGMTRGQIRMLVVYESFFLGTVGALMGALAGITTAWIIHLCNQPLTGRSLPFAFHGWLLAANAGGCMLVTLIAAWAPGARAARLDVLKAISYE